MSEKRCPLCGIPFANPGAHAPTPELGGTQGDRVWFCFASARHVTRRASWAEDFRRSLRRAARRSSRGES